MYQIVFQATFIVIYIKLCIDINKPVCFVAVTKNSICKTGVQNLNGRRRLGPGRYLIDKVSAKKNDLVSGNCSATSPYEAQLKSLRLHTKGKISFMSTKLAFEPLWFMKRCKSNTVLSLSINIHQPESCVFP